MNDKLDTLIASSSSSVYSEAVVKAIVEKVLKEHDTSIQKATEVVTASVLSSKKVVDDDKTLIHDARIFLESLQGAAEANANKVNATIESLSKSLQAEKQKFDQVCSSLETDQASLQSSIESLLEKLQADLALENKILDELTRQTTLIKTQSVWLTQAHKEIEELKYELHVMKSWVSDVYALLSNILDTHDSVLTITARRHLADILRPGLDTLSGLPGVLASVFTPQQGGERTEDLPNQTLQQPLKSQVSTGPKDNEALGSGVNEKDKGIMGEEEEEEETKEAALKRKKRDREFDENSRIARKAEERERKHKEAHDTLESRKILVDVGAVDKGSNRLTKHTLA